MWKAFVTVLPTLSSLSEASSPEAQAPTEPLTIPVKEGFVTVNIDGQEIGLFLDSGCPDLTVLDGHWYEQEYGKDACKEPSAGCYFCPEDDPCDFEETELALTHFGDNTTLKSVPRSGSLRLADREAADFDFSVARVVHWGSPSKPHGFFGLSRIPTNPEEYEYSDDSESLIDSLVDHGLIERPSYTFRTNTTQNGLSITGQLTLGEKLDESTATKYKWQKIVYSEKFHEALATVWVSSVKMSGGRSRLLPLESRASEYPGPNLTTIDTGGPIVSLAIPGLLEDLEKSLKMKLRRKGYDDEKIARMFRRDENGFLFVKQRVFKYLPVLKLRLDDGSNSVSIKIYPQHYCVGLESGELELMLQSETVSVLGTPFFWAYSIYVNFDDHKIALVRN
ncbi:hypothetical protein FOZ62_003048 [Perkinsus olseni]|uniref:Peptidase A1 domain-containing protein n=1 Tax=Perkinsus olseni TaxID=32597 RepID=A0A7J6PPG4_PEROL|nr:hypothetical protein FOZ62_003048 [Perkinsus olseni]